MTAVGVLRGGLRTLEPEDSEAVKRAERYVRNVVDRFKTEQEPKFTVFSCVMYYR